MNTYTLELYDCDEDRRCYYNVDTEKSIQEVVETYEKAHDEWYNDEDGEFDCLIAHIEMRLSENGMTIYPLEIDAKLDF